MALNMRAPSQSVRGASCSGSRAMMLVRPAAVAGPRSSSSSSSTCSSTSSGSSSSVLPWRQQAGGRARIQVSFQGKARCLVMQGKVCARAVVGVALLLFAASTDRGMPSPPPWRFLIAHSMHQNVLLHRQVQAAAKAKTKVRGERAVGHKTRACAARRRRRRHRRSAAHSLAACTHTRARAGRRHSHPHHTNRHHQQTTTTQ